MTAPADKKISDPHFHIGHRARLRQKFLDGQIADYELLELALSFAIPRRDVRPVARALLARFGTMYQILTASVDALAVVPGMGQNSAIFIKTMHKIMTIGFRDYVASETIFKDYTSFENYCRMLVGGKQVEEFHVFYLDNRFSLLLDELHSVGTVNESKVYPREIVRRALELNARAVALLHNHPTPFMDFSDDDIKMTLEIDALLAAINIQLYDHYVVSGSVVFSARNRNILR